MALPPVPAPDAFGQARAIARGLAVDLSRLGRIGLAGLLLFACALATWALAAPLSHAVNATGSFVVETQLRNVQHPTGGMVTDILVAEGDRVEAGQEVARLDDAVQRASHAALTHQRQALEGRLARLEIEREGSARSGLKLASLGSGDLWPDIAEAERTLFEARRQAREGQRRQMQLRVDQAGDELEGLRLQRHAKAREAELVETELAGLAALHKRQLVPLSRLTQMQRAAAVLAGEIHGFDAQIAQTQARIAELRLQVDQVTQTGLGEASEQIREVQARLAETLERLRTSEQQLDRMVVRAPVPGIVHSLTAARPGAQVAAGASVFQIVPDGETLHVDAVVRADDYGAIRLGQGARLRLHAFNPRTTPELLGTVTRLDPNSRRDQTSGAQVFTIRVSVQSDQLARLGRQRLRAGMTADVVVATAPTSPLEKLSIPLSDLASRAFRER